MSSCSFCGKPKKDTRAMVATQTKEFHICDKCVDKCKNIITKSRNEQKVVTYV